MLTGTPLDLTPFGDVLRWVSNGIWIVWLVATFVILIRRVARRESTRDRLLTAGKVLGVMVGIPAMLIGWQAYTVGRERAEFRARYEKAETLFKKRCETAGEFIYKTVPDVKGIVWMKWRPTDINLSDQFRMDDPFGRDCGGEECFKELLRATFEAPNQDMNTPRLPEAGYEFVETVDPRDGKWYRYTAGVLAVRTRTPEERAIATRNNRGIDPGPAVFDFAVRRAAVSGPTARYGATWEDISTREDRESWIAGGSLSVVDLKTNEVIAKRVGYMMDKGLGNEGGFRSPWGLDTHDNSCPPKLDEAGKKTMVGFTRRFALAVLQPSKGEKQ